MAFLKEAQVLDNLPGTLNPNTIYYVKVTDPTNGLSFDMYISDNTGTTAYKLNGISSDDNANLQTLIATAGL